MNNNLYVSNLTISYKNENNNNFKNSIVINDLSLQVNEGELLVILGSSGCGKSTLLSAISGLIKPNKGTINFSGNCFFDKKQHINLETETRNIGFCFQDYALWPHMSVYENLAFPLRARKFSEEKIDKKVREILKIVNLNGYQKRYPGELSGGEKQRVALARSLIYNPKLLLLDEPLANLDAKLKSSLIHEIKNIHNKLNLTTIYVTHDQAEAFEVADKIVVMNDGKIIQIDSPKNIYFSSNNLFVAQFVGDSNIIDTENYVPPYLDNAPMNKQIAIRLEDVVISKNGKYEGKIIDAQFKGNHSEYIIEAYHTKLRTIILSNNILSIGTKILFDIIKYSIY